MLTIKIRRLDQVTLTRRYLSPSSLGEFYDTLGVAWLHASGGEFEVVKKEYVTTFSKSYLGKKWGAGISFDFFGVQKKPAIAINCTPSKMAEEEWEDFIWLLASMFPDGPEQVWSDFKISALEIVVDVKVPLDELVCLAPKVTIVETGYRKRGTLYLGHEYGRRSYCLYDKRRQLAQKKKTNLGYELSRIEVTLRQTGKYLSQLVEISRPFGNLLVLRKPALIKLREENPLSIELSAFTSAVLSGAVAQLAYLDLDPYSRKLLLKLLKPVALNLNAKTQDWDVWIAKQQSAFQAKFLGHG